MPLRRWLDLIVLTKDSDFRNSFLIKKSPRKLVKINLGNISNQALAEIFTNNRSVIENLKSKETFLLEIGNNSLYLLEP